MTVCFRTYLHFIHPGGCGLVLFEHYLNWCHSTRKYALLIVAISFLNRTTRSGDTISLVGSSHKDKTTFVSSVGSNSHYIRPWLLFIQLFLLYFLTSSSCRMTPLKHTSLQQNIDLFHSPSPFCGRALRVVNIPGYSIIYRQFAIYLQGEAKAGSAAKVVDVRGVIYVHDAVKFTQNASTVFEWVLNGSSR